VVKVHTDRGVISLSGAADSWEQVDEALFVAESIADVQLVNNEVAWTVESD
jgi:osmotically-inducible protein OsmY